MRKIIFALAFGVILLPDYGFSLGLGDIEVTTALNQELNAEIELLSAAPEDVETLIVKLASRAEFARAGIDRPYLLNSLKFNAEMRNGVPVIRVTSDKPIREPFLNFLVEIDWPKGHMMREYTILLDPPVFMGQQQAPAENEQSRPAAMDSSSTMPGTAPDPQGGSDFRPSTMAATGASVPAPVPAAGTSAQADPYRDVTSQAVTPVYTPAANQSPSDYRIQPGDTLWSLADALRPDQTVTIEQMMLALLRTNPEAFINQNINGLKRGFILRVPDRDEITGLSQADAVARVLEQHALWREYQQAVTPADPETAMDRESGFDEGTAFGEGGDARLEIVAAGSGVTASGSKDPTQMSESELRAELAIARESLETERVEKEELQQRVSMLEGQVDRMKSLLTLQDTDLAEMQEAATPADIETLSEEPAFEEVFEETELEMAAEEDEFAEDPLADLESLAEDMAATEEALLDEEGIAEEEELLQPDAEEESVFVEEDALEALEQDVIEDEVVEPPVSAGEDFTVEPATQPAFMQQNQGPLAILLNNPVLLAAAGGGLLLVLLLIALIMRRRRSSDDDEPEVASNLDGISEELENDTVAEADQIFAESEETAQQAVAEAESALEDQVPDAVASEEVTGDEDTAKPAAATATDPGSRDDVIAEADVYLAYGIYQQAEELLQNAIKQNPDNDAYRVKLAETYLASKNTDGFVELATEMDQRRAGKDTPAWKKIVEIGAQLTPGHALFGGGAADLADDLNVDDVASEQTEALDISLDETEEQAALAPDLDLGFGESGLGDQPDESVEFDLAETGADTLVEDEPDGVEFDLSETGIDTQASADTDAVEFDLDEAQAVSSEQADDEEFSLDIEAGELEIADEGEARAAEADAGDDFGVDLNADDLVIAVDEQEEQEFSLDEVDTASLELDIGDDESTAAEAAEVAELDETETLQALEDEADAILDLSDAEIESITQPELAEAPSLGGSDDDELDLSDLDDIDEVGTKLDLAKAYLDMGDADGTRSILDEVMSEGDDTQKREAEELLRQIG